MDIRIQGYTDTRYRILAIGYWLPDTGYRDTGYWLEDTGYTDTGIEDTGYWIQDTGYRILATEIPEYRNMGYLFFNFNN